MDELLYDRVKQLKEIDDRLERMLAFKAVEVELVKVELVKLPAAIRALRHDLALMIQKAEQDSADF